MSALVLRPLVSKTDFGLMIYGTNTDLQNQGQAVEKHITPMAYRYFEIKLF